MNAAFLDCARSFMLASSPVYRRQQFLIRSLGGASGHQTDFRKMQDLRSIEADAESIVRAITPALDPARHKGQAGKIAVIGGCREYTGAPYFAAISALKIGADLSHVFCTKDAAPVIKSYSPELIVHPILEESCNVRDEDKKSISGKVLAEVDKWMERFDCLVIGPGLGRDPFLLDCVSEILRHARQSNIPIVIDGDGLFLVTNSIDLVSGYALAVLTPNVNEYKRLVQKVLSAEVNDLDAPQQLLSLSKQLIPPSMGTKPVYCGLCLGRIGGVTILRKGKNDLISDGDTVKSVSIYGSPRRCGGQGDILSGRQERFLCFVLGSIAGSTLMRKAASLAFLNKKRSTVTGDIIECLGRRGYCLSKFEANVRYLGFHGDSFCAAAVIFGDGVRLPAATSSSGGETMELLKTPSILSPPRKIYERENKIKVK
ncbi:ATP-dependent (S)-NAD(P)H-hydrate dehydratase isoform X1 [Senna tora]|uniref:ATP-dependent (S)-NAD(P)H-hydrate dehydratase n=1 Tax=Senna tora TaxID=362788 RepID=A0A834X3K0_9FABA|nr:ATP-dependent (S)-NAD(P)H-hydrate dehydratase isoform X1 [Senna tora]